MNKVLADIIAQKHLEVARPKKSLEQALRQPRAILSEIKRASPAKGKLADILNPVDLAKQYQEAGAAAISVLTDKKYFNGSLDDLVDVSQALKQTLCPILRKEFIISPIQIAEAAVHGADAVLLIVAVLKEKTQEFINVAKLFNLDVLVEVHTHDELKLALDTDAKIIGINNRNLDTLDVDIQTSLDLIQYLPNHLVKVSESGIHDSQTAQRLFNAGFDALLVGEALVKSDYPAELIKKMRGVA